MALPALPLFLSRLCLTCLLKHSLALPCLACLALPKLYTAFEAAGLPPPVFAPAASAADGRADGGADGDDADIGRLEIELPAVVGGGLLGRCARSVELAALHRPGLRACNSLRR